MPWLVPTSYRLSRWGSPATSLRHFLSGAFIIHGIVPGPFMMVTHGELIYALFASMLIANGIHLIIGRLGITIWSYIAKAPKPAVLPPVIVLCIVGVFLPGQSLFDVSVMLVFAGVGLAMRRTGFSPVCLVIGFLLGSLFEGYLRQPLLLYKFELSAVVESPIALAFLALTAIVLLRAFWKIRS
ncbi:MAG: tripartite tricarboxylate transporter permease [Minwuiales bacterium]|nr:tripartite tricarboxylate transporter permease [Minwuiales bacterium]